MKLPLPYLAITVPCTVLLMATACSKTTKEEIKVDDSVTEQAEPDGPRPEGAIEGEYTVECGCTIKSINKCGNYVHVDGHQFEIKGDLGLGKMEWCGQGQHQAQVKGSLQGEDFYAESLSVNQ